MADRFGEPMDRVDGRAKVTGAAKYAYEQDVPGAAYAMLVTSSVAKGRVASIDSREAGRSPRVLMVLTHENSLKQAGLVRKNDKGSPGEALQVLQDDVIHFAGQPIAVVVAETYTHAHAAAKLLKIRYQEAEPAIDLDSRASSAYVPEKAGAAGDPSISNRGDFQSAFAQSDSRIQHTYRTPFQVHNPMEPHATIARWDGPDQLTIYDATQGVFNDRDRIAAAFGLDKNRVRVISPFLGGGFGSKGPTWSHVVLAAMAAKQVRRPVKLAVARPQMFGPVGLRSETRQDIAIGANKDGTI
ncbi:MAG: xanthine dehydrogenase family protein molybdopterin-binding subunit, partial [Acidobacteriaceae bacterium]|nr:xanthine dehydrogenase family protein molybdopterin-binding subunit [Acidobacteriaceae bacterium]